MNKDRRSRLDELKEQLTGIMSGIEEIRDEEEAAYENLPESLQESERGEAMQNAVDTLGDIFDTLATCIDDLEEIITL